MTLIFTLLGWGMLAIITAMRFTTVPRFSDTERARLLRQGNPAAREEARRIELAPLLMSLHNILRVTVVSLFITFCVLNYGVVNGIVVGTAGVLLVPLVFRVSLVCRLADALRDKMLPWLNKAAITLKPLLRWLRDRDVAVEAVSLHSQEELLDLVRRSPGVLSREEQERLIASLRFDETKVADVMTPRSMIDAVPVGEALGPLVLDELYKTGHSRFPVYKGDLDHVVGMLYLHDLLDIRQGNKPAQEAMQSKVYFIRDDKDLTHALHGFLSTRHHLFVVVNSYRETVGLLSLEDTLEALLGAKIQDEFDAFDDLRAVAAHNPHKNNQPTSVHRTNSEQAGL